MKKVNQFIEDVVVGIGAIIMAAVIVIFLFVMAFINARLVNIPILRQGLEGSLDFFWNVTKSAIVTPFMD